MLYACLKDVPNVMVIVWARTSTFILSVPVLITVEPVWVVGYNNEGIKTQPVKTGGRGNSRSSLAVQQVQGQPEPHLRSRLNKNKV